jgi:hypothetical protein
VTFSTSGSSLFFVLTSAPYLILLAALLEPSAAFLFLGDTATPAGFHLTFKNCLPSFFLNQLKKLSDNFLVISF